MRPPYSFESSDSLARWGAWLNHIFFTGMFTLLSFPLTGWLFVCTVLLLCTLHVAGLRASITVTDAEVVIRKKWFFIPYKTHRAPEITGVWYGGDWGLEDDAIGVVVELGGEEVHIGTRLNMGELHAALSPYASSNRAMAGAA